MGASTTAWTTLRRVIRFLGGGGGGGALSHAVGGGVSVYLGGSLCVEKLKSTRFLLVFISYRRTYTTDSVMIPRRGLPVYLLVILKRGDL